MRWPVFHTTHGPRLFSNLSHQANDCRTCSRFFNFWPWEAYPCVKVHQKGRWHTIHLDLQSYKISARSRKRSTRYALPNVFRLFGSGANPWAKVHQRGRWLGGLLGLPSCNISSLYAAPRPRYTLPDRQRKTCTPVVRSGYIPTCRSPSPPAVASLSHGPRDCAASLSHLANDRPMHYRFYIFWPGG